MHLPDAVKLPISNQCCLPGLHDSVLYQIPDMGTTYEQSHFTILTAVSSLQVPLKSIHSSPLPKTRKEKTMPFGISLTRSQMPPGLTFWDALQAAPEHQRQECKLASHYRQGLAGPAVWH